MVGRLVRVAVALAALVGGAVAFTTRADAAWTTQSSSTTSTLMGVACATATNCWAVGSGGVIVTTTNGGASWTAQSSGTTDHLYGVACPASSQCVVVGVQTILTTVNGGVTWTSRPAGASYGQINAVSCPTTLRCWLADASGKIATSSDGGGTWTTQVSGTTADLRSVFCADVQRCWVTGAFGTTLVTGNGGSTWTTQALGTSAHQYGFRCSTTSTCWTTGDDGLHRTTNSGSTWASHHSGAALRSVSCGSTLQCVAVGGSGAIVITTDGGSIWSPETSGTSSQLFGVSCPSTTRCVAVGSGGIVLTYTPPPPPPTITGGPPSPSSSPNASFSFVGEPGATMQCGLDGAAFTACSSPKTYSGLSDGSHTFRVRQVNAANDPSSPATYSWTIDTIKQCNDGVDNDDDGKVDYPADPGCAAPMDDAEGATCPPVAPGVIACLDAGTEVRQVDVHEPGSGTSHQVVGSVDLYRFQLPGGVTVTLPCVTLSVDGGATSPCVDAGGLFVSVVATLVDRTVAEPTLVGDVVAAARVCNAELTLTVLGAGVSSAPALVLC